MSNLLLMGCGGPPNATIFSTLNPLDAAVGWAFSNANLTGSWTNPPNVGDVRGTLSHATGQWHFEVTITNGTGGFTDYPRCGIANAAMALNSDLGSTADSVGYEKSGALILNSVSLGLVDAFVTGDVIAFEPDFSLKTLAVQKLGGTGRKGPFPITTLTLPAFVAFGGHSGLDVMTLNVGASAFAIAPTGGYAPWG